MSMNAEQMASALADILSEQGIPEGQGTTEQPAETPEEAVPAELAGHDEGLELEAKSEPVAEEAEAETPSEPVQQEVALPTDINGLSEAIGTEASYLYSITVPVTEGDKSEQVPIGQLKDRLQESQREINRLKDQPAPTQTGPSLSAAQQDYRAVESASQQLERGWIEYQQSEEWLKLQQDDPQEALRTISRVELKRREAAHARQVTLEAVQAEQRKLIAEMPNYIPEWSNADVMAADKQAIKATLKAAGVSPGRIDSETDPAVVAVWREWMKMKETPKPKPSPSGLKPLVPASKPTSGAKPNPKAQMQKAQRLYGKAKTPEQKAAAFNKILGL